MEKDLQDLSQLVLLNMGATTITLGSLFGAIVVLVLAMLTAKILTYSLRRLRDRTTTGRGALYLVEKLIGYSLVGVGIIVAFTTLGLNLSALTFFAGAFGLGIGLGLQGVVKEFVSGLVLIFDRLISIGDFIELDNGKRGVVQEIGPRATRIRTNDNVHLLLPNSALIDNIVVNWTLRDAARRIHVPFSVAYGSDKVRVREVVLAAAKSVAFTLPDIADRKTQVWLVGFGDSGLKFELVVWPTLEASKRPAAMQAAYTWAIDDALRAEGLHVPYPQMDLHIKSMFGRERDDALHALRLDGGNPVVAAPPPPQSTVNDAAEDLQRPQESLDPPDVQQMRPK